MLQVNGVMTHGVTATVGGAADVRCGGRVLAPGHADTSDPAVVQVGYSITVWLTVLTKVLTMVSIVNSLICVVGFSCSSSCVVALGGCDAVSARHTRLLALRLTASSRERNGVEAALRPDICGGQKRIRLQANYRLAFAFFGIHFHIPLSRC